MRSGRVTAGRPRYPPTIRHLRLLALALVFGARASPARPDAGRPESSVLAVATAHLREGKVDEAIRSFSDLTSQYPSWPDAHLGLGYALERKQDYVEAARAYERALRLDPRDVRALNNLGSIQVSQGTDLTRGLDLLRRAIRLRPDFAVAWDNLGWGEYRRRNYGRAAQAFKTAIARDPGLVSAHFHLGLFYMRREDYRLAQIEFRTVVQTDPGHVRGWTSLGLTHQRTGHKQEAYQAYSRALSLMSGDGPMTREVQRMVHQLGPLYASGLVGARSPSLLAGADAGATGVAGAAGPAPDRRRQAPARAPVTLAGRVAPATAGAAALGSRPATGLTPRHHREALDLLEGKGAARAAGPTPSSPAVTEAMVRQDLVDRHLRYAQLYARSDLPEDARSEAETVINLAPWSGAAGRARSLIRELEDRSRPALPERIRGLMTLGEGFARDRETAAAILQFEKVLLLAPEEAVAYKNLAWLNVTTGKSEIGLAQARKALEIEPEFQEALLIKGYVEARDRRFREAYDTYRRLGEIAPEGSRIHGYAREMVAKLKRFVELQ